MARDQYRPPDPSPETMKVAEDWYTYGFQAGMEAERRARAISNGNDVERPSPRSGLMNGG